MFKGLVNTSYLSLMYYIEATEEKPRREVPVFQNKRFAVMASFHYGYQNPSVFMSLMLYKNLPGVQNLNNEDKTRYSGKK